MCTWILLRFNTVFAAKDANYCGRRRGFVVKTSLTELLLCREQAASETMSWKPALPLTRLPTAGLQSAPVARGISDDLPLLVDPDADTQVPQLPLSLSAPPSRWPRPQSLPLAAPPAVEAAPSTPRLARRAPPLSSPPLSAPPPPPPPPPLAQPVVAYTQPQVFAPPLSQSMTPSQPLFPMTGAANSQQVAANYASTLKGLLGPPQRVTAVDQRREAIHLTALRGGVLACTPARVRANPLTCLLCTCSIATTRASGQGTGCTSAASRWGRQLPVLPRASAASCWRRERHANAVDVARQQFAARGAAGGATGCGKENTVVNSRLLMITPCWLESCTAFTQRADDRFRVMQAWQERNDTNMEDLKTKVRCGNRDGLLLANVTPRALFARSRAAIQLGVPLGAAGRRDASSCPAPSTHRAVRRQQRSGAHSGRHGTRHECHEGAAGKRPGPHSVGVRPPGKGAGANLRWVLRSVCPPACGSLT